MTIPSNSTPNHRAATPGSNLYFHMFPHATDALARGKIMNANRRQFLAAAGATVGVASFPTYLAAQANELRKQGRSLIVLYMQGGPSQLETFDPKPGHEHGGPTEAIATVVPGIQIAQGWTKTAEQMRDIALIRSMTNKEGNHQRASYQVHTGYLPTGSVKHPMFGSNIARQIAPHEFDLPAVVTIGNDRNQLAGAAFLGVEYEPFHVGNPGSMPENLTGRATQDRLRARLTLLGKLDDQFASRGGEVAVTNHRGLYDKASKMALTPLNSTFDLSKEPAALRESYGDTSFGRGCLLARRLVETGVTFVEVRHGNWDTHQDNFTATSRLAGEVDPGFGTLVRDLKDRGMLDRTVVLWIGEFGRTPKINPRTGRDHYPRVFSAAIAGGGVKGGQVIGRSSADGTSIEDRPVSVDDLFCSVCQSLKVDARHENMSPLGRPMKIVDAGQPVQELFA